MAGKVLLSSDNYNLTAVGIYMRPRNTPLAIISMACRFPQIDSVAELLAALKSGSNLIDEVPRDRWDPDRYYSSDPASKGKTYTRRGGFIRQDPKTFDAGFFGISPREAENMDPQQRLILEVTWEAFENCGLVLPEFAKTNVGVYVGGFMLDHMITQMAFSNRSQINQNSAAGMMMTMLSNRVSHTFDFRGPSMSLDTACSSSLVAFHVGCQDLWRGACDMALIGGTNVMMRPEYPMGMCKGHFLSKDGESKSFDERGDGYGRGEGCGVLLLKPLDQALRDNNPVLATVLATGTNQDGRTPGISMPNGEAQQALIEQVCRENEIAPTSIDYVECHGTGTAIGDPTECQAIGNTYGSASDREKNPVVIGSIKSNIGHLEAAAGVAGLIKAVLTLQERQAFPLGNLQEVNPKINLEESNIRLADTSVSLGRDAQPLRVAVNSFGYGGSNAHAILESAPMSADLTAAQSNGTPANRTNGSLNGSRNGAAHSKRQTWQDCVFQSFFHCRPNLRAHSLKFARKLADRLESEDVSLNDVTHTLIHHRAQLAHRAVALGKDREDVRKVLEALATGELHDQLVTDSTPFKGHRKPVFVFTGMGPQWWYMGQHLYANVASYRDRVTQADEIFRSISGFSILKEMLKSETESQVQKTVYAQPANFIIQMGIFHLLEEAGVHPGLVVGHSVGELGSAYAAGILSLEDALKVSYFRSQIQAKAAGTGGMLAAGLSKQDALERIQPISDLVSLAAINGSSSVTLAGDIDTLQRLADQLTTEDIFNRMLEVEIPYHSPLMDPLKDELRDALRSLQPKSPELPVYSTVTGKRVTEPSFGADYWPENIREPVEFEQAIHNILDEGYNTFVEIGPHPVLSTSLRDCFTTTGSDCRLIHTLRRNLNNEEACIWKAVASIHAAGCEVDWGQIIVPGQQISLPNYAWDREMHWSENDRAAQDRINPIVHPILGTQEALSAPVWRNDFDHEPMKYLREHVVSGMPVLPAAAYLEALLELGSIQYPDSNGLALRKIQIQRPLINTVDRGTDFTTTFDAGSQTAIQRSLENGKLGTGQEHLQAQVAGLQINHRETIDIQAILENSQVLQEPEVFYGELNQLGLNYGHAFQTVRELRQRQSGEVLTRLEVQPELENDLARYHLHPTLLDGAFQSLMSMLGSSDTTYLPTHVEELVFYPQDEMRAHSRLWCIGKMIETNPRSMTCSLTLVTEEGHVVCRVDHLVASAANQGGKRLDKYGDPVKRQILQYHWDYGETPAEPKRLGHWLFVGNAEDLSQQVQSRLEGFGAVVKGHVAYGEEFERTESGWQIRKSVREDANQVIEQVGELAGVVFFVGLDDEVTGNCPTGQEALNQLVVFTQAMLEIPAADRPRVYVITRGCFRIEDHDTDFEPGAAAINGWVRVACSELAGFRFSTIDIDDPEDEESIEALALELACDLPEDEVAIRSDFRFVSELRESPILENDIVVPAPLDVDHPVTIRPLLPGVDSIGTFRTLAFDKPKTGPSDVAIQVEKSLLPSNLLRDQSANEIEQTKLEIVGTVVETGSDVTDLAPGDKVCGLAPADLASLIVAPREDFVLTALPAESNTSQLLVDIGRVTLAKRALQRHELNPGSRVLVEYGENGIAVANELQRDGADVTFLVDDPATLDAEVREKYRFCLACPDTIRKRVDSDGRFELLAVDLSNWATRFGFRMLAPNGGLLDLAEVSHDMTHLPATVGAISRMDLAAWTHDRPRLEKSLAESVLMLNAEQTQLATPFDVSVFDLAWKKLPLGDTDAKLVLSYENNGQELPAVQSPELTVRSEATYLITGGFGGFGQKTAHWLIDQGATCLVLTGRSGANTDEKRAFVKELEDRGARVQPVACDTGDAARVTEVLHEIQDTLPPLKGIFHSGAVILDQAIAETDLPTFNTVMSAKATGAWNLHRLSLELEIDLDHFVMYSSLSNQIGNSRQGAYCAANGYLNGLARLRRSMGLPAISINWGAISDVGVVTQDEKLEQFLRHVGLRGLPSAEGLGLLREALAREVEQFGVVVIKSWTDWARYETLSAQSPRFAAVVAADAEGDNNGMKQQLVAELAELGSVAQIELMSQLSSQIVASVLKTDPENVDINRPINELGIDSLMATEIQVLFESQLGVAISVLELLGDVTVRKLSADIIESLQDDLAAWDSTGPKTEMVSAST